MNLGLAGLHDRKQNWDVRRPILLVVAVMACSTSGLDGRKSQQQGTDVAHQWTESAHQGQKSAVAVSESAGSEAALMEQAPPSLQSQLLTSARFASSTGSAPP